MNSPPSEPLGAEMTGSVSHWLDGLRAGDSVAAQELWNRYFARLLTVVEIRLSRLSAEASGGDVALSALKSIMMQVKGNRFPNLNDRDSLWPLLVTITARKAISEQRRQLSGRPGRNLECNFEDLRDFIGVEPLPGFAVEVADELERLVSTLGDASLRKIAERGMAGFTNEEIAAELNCSQRTVIRKLQRIRREWREGLVGSNDPEGSGE